MSENTNVKNMRIQINSSPVYSLAFIAGNVPMVSSVVLEGFDSDKPCDLVLTISGICREGKLFETYSATYENFTAGMYSIGSVKNAVVKFNPGELSPIKNLFSQVKLPCEGTISVKAEYNGTSCLCRKKIMVLPSRFWQGLGVSPELAAVFVTPGAKKLRDVLSGCDDARKKHTPEKKIDILEQVYRSLHSRNLVYTRTYSDPYKEMHLKLADSVFEKRGNTLTPIELALLFTSCAEYVHLSPVILFCKGETGAVNIFAGAWSSDKPCVNMLCDDGELLNNAISSGNLVLIDPSSFTAGHSTGFAQSCREAQRFIGTSKILFCLDIEEARKRHIQPIELPGDLKGNGFSVYEKSSASTPDFGKEIKDISDRLLNNCNNSLLTDFFSSDCLKIPVLLNDIYDIETKSFAKKNLTFCPDEIDLSSALPYLKNFCSVYMDSDRDYTHLSYAELNEAKGAAVHIKNAVSKTSYLVSPLKYEELTDLCTKMYFSESGSVYYASGFLRDREENVYAPIALAEAGVSINDSNACISRYSDKAKPNSVLAVNLLKKLDISATEYYDEEPSDLNQTLELFEKICELLNRKENKARYEVVRETYIFHSDLSEYKLHQAFAHKDFSLDSDIAISAVTGQHLPQKASYHSSIKNFCPLFGVDELQKDAILTDGSFILEGAKGTGKTNTVLNVVSKSVLEGKSVLVVSDNSFSKEAFINTYAETGFEGVLEVNSRNVLDGSLKEKLLECAKNVSGKPFEETDFPDKLINNSYEMYEYELHRKQEMGFSLYEAVCIYENTLSQLGRDVPLINLPPEMFDGMNKEGFEEILKAARNLINSSLNANKNCSVPNENPMSAHPLRAIKSVNMKNFSRKKISSALMSLRDNVKEYVSLSRPYFEKINIDSSALTDFNKLKFANTLLELSYDSMDIDLSEDIGCEDLDSFIAGVNKVRDLLLRKKQIEDKLCFFEKEIYSDGVELIADDTLQGERHGVFSKIIAKKNAAEVFADYIIPGKKHIFQKTDNDEIIALLKEHNEIRKSLSDENLRAVYETRSFNNTVKVSDYAEKASIIYRHISGETDRISNIKSAMRFALKLNADNCHNVERICELFSNIVSSCNDLSDSIGLYLPDMTFEDGAFGERDGMLSQIEVIEKNSFAIDVWNEWISAKEYAASVSLDAFAQAIENQGVEKDTNLIFAASVFKSVIKYLTSKDTGELLYKMNTDDYRSLLSSKLSEGRKYLNAMYANDVYTYFNCDDGKKELDKLLSVISSGASFREIMGACFDTVKRLFPVIVTDNITYAAYFPDKVFSQGIFLASSSMKIQDAVFSVSCVESAIFVTEPYDTLGKNMLLSKLKLQKVILERVYSSRRGEIFAYINSCLGGKLDLFCRKDMQDAVEFNAVLDGRYDRLDKKYNNAEVRECAKRARECVNASPDKSVIVVAMTDRQAYEIKKALFLHSGDDKAVRTALENKRLTVCSARNAYDSSADIGIVSVAFGRDDYYIMNYDFGVLEDTNASASHLPRALMNVLQCARERLIVYSSIQPEAMSQNESYNSAYAAVRDFLYFCKDRTVMLGSHYQIKPNDNLLRDILARELEKLSLNVVSHSTILNNSVDIEIPGGRGYAGLYVLMDSPSPGDAAERLERANQIEKTRAGFLYISALDIIAGMESTAEKIKEHYYKR